MDTDFKLTSELKDDVLIMHTSGYVNNEGGEKIAEEFDKYFEQGLKKVIINLEQSKVVNSIGISFLLEIIEKLNDTNGRLIFTNLEAAVEKTFSIMGLFNYAGQAGTIDNALESIKITAG